MNIPKLRFPEFEGGWKSIRLGEISNLITKGTTPSKFTETGIKFIKIECFDGNTINPNKCLFIDEQTHKKELKRSILKENDILFAIAGATIGKVNFVEKSILPANTNQALSIIRLNDKQNKNFIYQNLKSVKMQKYILDNISVGAQPNLNLEQMNNFSFNLPTLPEQTKIANFLTIVDDKLTQLKKKKSLLEQYKKGVMQQIFSQKLRFKNDDGSDFEDWEERKLGEVIDHVGGTSLEEYVAIGEKYKFISIGNYSKDGKYIDNNQRISSNDKSRSKVLNKGDLVMVLNDKTSSGDLIGSTILIDSDDSYIYNQRSERLICKTNIHPPFLWHYLNSNLFRKSIFLISQGGTQIYVNFPIVKKLQTCIPSLPEQFKIANFLSAIDEKINQCGQQVEKMEGWKKGLLQQMFV